MIKNYFLIALRNLLKHKIFSFINVAGLALGIACCTLLTLYIRDEFSYEKNFTDAGRVYRINTMFIRDGRESSFPRTSPSIAMDMLHELPEVESATRMVVPPEVEKHLVRYKEESFYEKDGYLVDSTFFDIFDYDFKEGDRATALDGPSSVVLSETLADKIFKGQSPLDELLIINSGWSTDTFRITGVVRAPEKPSQVDASFYMSMNSRGWGDEISRTETWAWQNFLLTYVKLRPGIEASVIDSKMATMLEAKAGSILRESGVSKKLFLQPLLDVRLYSEFSNSFGSSENAKIEYVYILSTIAVFILLLACINFMNLTTAKASQRAGEVGVRKSLGATRFSLIKQFLGESVTIVSAAIILAIGLVQLVLPVFNTLTQKTLSINAENLPYIAASLIGIGLVTAVVAGSYPAFFLSSFQPAKVLKDKRLSGGSSNFLRKTLVVFQFTIAITLISAIVIIQKQLSFIQNKPLGFEAENKVLVPMRTEEAKNNYENVKSSFRQLAGVEIVTGSSSLPSTPLLRDFSLYAEGSTLDKAINHRNIAVDENYFKAMNIPIVAGRELIFETDSLSWSSYYRRVIVNETSLKMLNIEFDKAIGTKLFSEWNGEKFTHEIVGVVSDFHQYSLHDDMAPLIFSIPAVRATHNFLLVSTTDQNPKNLIASLENEWKTIVPNTPFESLLLTDSIARQYEEDTRTSTILSIATMLAILISCLGLYGLSIYVAERKVKEIGIRKVMGASVGGIVAMLSKDFVKLVIVAFALAVPMGYFAMNKWLEGFAYKIELDITVFIVSGVASLAIAWFTISFESIKAAISNPVKSLRNE